MNDADMMAYLRYRLIEPVLDAKKGSAGKTVKEISKQSIFDPYFNRSFSVSDRTIYRYLKLYRMYGFDGLKPKVNKNRNRHFALSQQEIQWITQLKQEQPLRSARKIIAMLEASGKVDAGQLKERTVSRVLHDMGYTRQNLTRDTKAYNHNISADIFEQYQGDMMEGVYITDKDGNKRKVYLFGFIDNFSKFVPHAQFYYESSLPRMEDCLKKAITKYGVPKRIYIDNGKVYVSDDFKLSCARLGIRLSYATPYHPAGKGCIERFWQFVQSDFLAELRLHPVDDIRMLNELFFAWLEHGYHDKYHSGIDATPRQKWQSRIDAGLKPTFVSPLALAEAFYYTDTRVVNKYGMISFEGNEYDVDAVLVGKKVEIRYDPFDISQLYIYLDDRFVCTARDHDPKRRVVSQYEGISSDTGSDPAISIDYLSLLRDRFYASIRTEAQGLIADAVVPRAEDKSKDMGQDNSNGGSGMQWADEADGGISRTRQRNGRAISDGTAASAGNGTCDSTCADICADNMTLDMFMNTIGRILGISCFTYADKEKIYGFYDTFKRFNVQLVEDTLERLKSQYDDFSKNIVFYLNMLKSAVDNINADKMER